MRFLDVEIGYTNEILNNTVFIFYYVHPNHTWINIMLDYSIRLEVIGKNVKASLYCFPIDLYFVALPKTSNINGDILKVTWKSMVHRTKYMPILKKIRQSYIFGSAAFLVLNKFIVSNRLQGI